MNKADAPIHLLSEETRRKLGMGSKPLKLCVGNGTPFCMKYCTETVPDNCPVLTGACDLSGTLPCLTCEIDCPCRENPPERALAIETWWKNYERK